MIRINLLPSGRKRAVVLPPVLIFGAVAAVGIFVVLVVLTFYLNKQISSKKAEISTQEQKLQSLKTKLKEVQNYEKDNEEFRKKTRIIEQLKKNQVMPLRLLDEVSEKLPKGVWLTDMEDKSGVVSIEGYSFSNNDLVSYVQNLKGSKYLEDVTLVESRQTEVEQISVYRFKLTFEVKV